MIKAIASAVGRMFGLTVALCVAATVLYPGALYIGWLWRNFVSVYKTF